MREHSEAWAASTKLCVKKPASAGCSDLFSKHFKPTLDSIKKELFQEAIDKKEHIIVVETGVTANPLALPAHKTYYKPLKTAGYDIHMAGVYTTFDATKQQGRTRAFSEGKQYPLGSMKAMMSWSLGVKKIAEHFQKARGKGNANTFVVVRNKWQAADTPADLKDACEKDCMSDIQCSGVGVKLYPKNLVSFTSKIVPSMLHPRDALIIGTAARNGLFSLLKRSTGSLAPPGVSKSGK